MSFKKGDIVRLKEQHKDHCPSFYGVDLIVNKYHEDGGLVDVVRVTGGIERGFFEFRVEKVRVEKTGSRVEGRTIKFKDIRIGDTILNAFDIDDLKITREGVVRNVGNSSGGGTQLWTAAGRRIDVDPHTDTYTLVKAVEEDKVLEKVKAFQQDGVVEFTSLFGSKILARKQAPLAGTAGQNWTVMYSDNWSYKTDEQFANIIRHNFNKVRWIG